MGDNKIIQLVSSKEKIEKPQPAAQERKPLQPLIEYAEEILARAKSGELVALGVAEVLVDEDNTDYAIGGFLISPGRSFAMNYSLERLRHRMRDYYFGGDRG